MQSLTIGQYLLKRLYGLRVKHIFGIPGDYVLRFNKLIEDHPDIQFVNTTRENCAGYAANAYAQLRGLGVACITYGVGIEIVSAIAQAYIENLPMVVISGTIATTEYQKHQECHHLINKVVNEFGDGTQLEIFKNVTIDQGVLNSPKTAAETIDRVLHQCLEHKKPVYLELPRDLVDVEITQLDSHYFSHSKTDAETLGEGMQEIQKILSQSKSPILWIGHEIARYHLNHLLLQFAEKYSIPIVSSLLGKTTIDEHHPLFLGVYQGEMSNENTIAAIHQCDCLLIAGVILHDLDTGIFTTKLNQEHCILATEKELKIDHHSYDIPLIDFINQLDKLKLPGFSRSLPLNPKKNLPFKPDSNSKTTTKRLFECLQSFLTQEHIVVSDVGDALFGSTELVLFENSFLSNSYYASIGIGIPTAIGAQFAQPSKRVVALIGDGGFQMSATELSTAIRYNLDPIVIVLNNHGYGTERVLLEGTFNDLVNWNYTKLPQLLGGGIGIRVETEEALSDALDKAFSSRGTFFLIEVELDKMDFSPSLVRLGKSLGKIVKS